MTNETKVQYLQRAAIACIIAGLGYFYFGFPFWFLNATDEIDAHEIAPFVLVSNNLLGVWAAGISGIAMFIAAYSFQKIGEPTAKRGFFYVLMVGATCAFLSTWFILPFAPLGAIFNGIGMVLVGIASLKARIWAGWRRYAPLIVGCFPFIFMFPLVILFGQRQPVMIGLWSIPWALLGLAAWQRAKELTLNNGIK